MADLEDPKSDPEITQQLILLELMRLYDVNMSLLSEMNDARAEHIQNVHDSGKLLTELPWLTDGEEEL